jgi:AraC-like DNA-binding protein
LRHGLPEIRHASWQHGCVRRAESLDAYLADSRDAFVVERSFTAFHLGALFGVAAWGRPDLDAARQIVRAREAELADEGPHYVVMDYRLLEGVDPEAFDTLAQFLNINREVLTRVTVRTALLVPSLAFAAATVSGFYSVVKSPYPSSVFTAIDEAEAWLGIPTVAPVTAVVEAATAARSLSAALTALLEERPGLLLDDAAAALGLSGRTLQRRLQLEGTTYAAEGRRAIVRKAKHLLTTTDRKIADIAIAVGCTTPQHFSEVFRAETGMSPAAWRRG